MNEVRTATPFRESSLAPKVTLRMFSSLSFFEKPRSRVRSWRTTSPSRRSTRRPRSSRVGAARSPTADFPEHGSPVNHRVKPSCSSHILSVSFRSGSKDLALQPRRKGQAHDVEHCRGDVEDVGVAFLSTGCFRVVEDIDPLLGMDGVVRAGVIFREVHRPVAERARRPPVEVVEIDHEVRVLAFELFEVFLGLDDLGLPGLAHRPADGFEARQGDSPPRSISPSLTQKAPFILFAPWSDTTRTTVSSPALAINRPILPSRYL